MREQLKQCLCYEQLCTSPQHRINLFILLSGTSIRLIYLLTSGTYYFITYCKIYGGTGTAKAVLLLDYMDRFSAGARNIYRLPRLQTGTQTQPTPRHWIPEDLSLLSDHRSLKTTTHPLPIEYEAGGMGGGGRGGL